MTKEQLQLLRRTRVPKQKGETVLVRCTRPAYAQYARRAGLNGTSIMMEVSEAAYKPGDYRRENPDTAYIAAQVERMISFIRHGDVNAAGGAAARLALTFHRGVDVEAKAEEWAQIAQWAAEAAQDSASEGRK